MKKKKLLITLCPLLILIAVAIIFKPQKNNYHSFGELIALLSEVELIKVCHYNAEYLDAVCSNGSNIK